MPIPPRPDRPACRSSVVLDALLLVALTAALAVGVGFDVKAYLGHKGQAAPAFRVIGALVGDRVGEHEFLHETASVLHLSNFGELEHEEESGRVVPYRWAEGETATVELWSVVTRMRVGFRLRNPMAGQTITVACNGKTLEELHLAADEVVGREYTVPLHPGVGDRFTLTFSRYASHGFELDNGEKRHLAAQILALDLYLPNANDDF